MGRRTNIRRTGRGGGGGSGGGGVTYQSILGPNLVFMLHSQMLVSEPVAGESDAWTDAISGTRTIVQAVPAQRMLYAAAGATFGGKRVLQSDRVAQRFLAAVGLGTIVPLGAKPWLYMRAAYLAVGAAEGNAAACGTNNDQMVFITNAGGTNYRKIGPSATTIDVAGINTAAHDWSSWSDPVNRNFMIDATLQQDTTNAAIANDLTAFAVGNTPGATRYSRVAIALILMCTAYPGAGPAAAAVARAQAEFPP